ncbi:MAG: diguanylate cyclase [Meiothermus sp.]|uniref:GGDEF domain-containing protein n=1 Tax=Meiothermus sp. TaxID=1955249 RepID=UPI0021DC0887|nr:sensor domain-containing diguanylate cyclase [Meiothermus sp.]GIW29575.1 MAG: diguanylate cyclase [Meiothermus sp.]
MTHHPDLQQQQETPHQLALLSHALQALLAANHREQLLTAIPRLLEPLGVQVGVWWLQHKELRLHSISDPRETEPLEQVAIQAHAQGAVVYTRCGRSSHNCAAIPLYERNRIAAIVVLKRRQAFGPSAQDYLEQLAQAASSRLTSITEQAEAHLMHQLSMALVTADSVTALAERALALLTSALGVQHGIILQQQGSRMRVLARLDVKQPPDDCWQAHISDSQGLFWIVHRTEQPIFIDQLEQNPSIQSIAVHPVGVSNRPRARVLLGLAHPEPHPWLPCTQDLLAMACRSIGLALEGAIARQRLERVLELSHKAALEDSESLYQQVLTSAVELIPGAEAGSLLVRKGECFRFQAVVGYDLESLQGLRFSEQDHLKWYGQHPAGWYAGEPRILSSELASIQERSASSSAGQTHLVAHTRRIQSNLAVPVLYQGRVLALLNLDNFHDPQAFGSDSLEVARFFATPVAALLHQTHIRQSLAEAALSDALTGLANRRAFNKFFDEELARSRRYQQAFALLVLDLQGFKTINDQLGHASGDEALVRVARALQKTSRKSDGLFRLGGDEFAAILSRTTADRAIQVAQRYAKAIQAIQIEGMALGVNIGLAVYPQDGTSKETLLRLADQRMYAAKAQRTSILRQEDSISYKTLSLAIP